jgi:hypothetical protein
MDRLPQLKKLNISTDIADCRNIVGSPIPSTVVNIFENAPFLNTCCAMGGCGAILSGRRSMIDLDFTPECRLHQEGSPPSADMAKVPWKFPGFASSQR